MAPDGTIGRAQAPMPCAFHPEVFDGQRVRAVAAGHCHIVTVTRREPSGEASGEASPEASVWSHGDACKGCLGHGLEPGAARSLALPARVAALEGLSVSAVACGPYHNLAVARGLVFAWGNNGMAQLGLADCVDRAAPALVPLSAFGFERVAEVAAGVEHGCALTEMGVLYTFGRGKAAGLGGRPHVPCGLGLPGAPAVQARPARVGALFERQPSGARRARLGRWHGIPLAHALAWLLGTLPPRAEPAGPEPLGDGPLGGPSPPARRSARLAARRAAHAHARRCWVAALPADVARIILDQCRGRHGWFAGDM